MTIGQEGSNFIRQDRGPREGVYEEEEEREGGVSECEASEREKENHIEIRLRERGLNDPAR